MKDISSLNKLEQAVLSQPLTAIFCDVFDTLIFREDGTIDELWRKLAICAHERGIISNDDPDWFVLCRKEAEETARRNMYQKEGHREVEIDQIYSFWPSESGEKLAELELEIEYNNWRLNQVLAEWLTNQRNNGIVLVLVSDMYLPSRLMSRFFEVRTPNLKPVKLYVSCEHKASKHDGGLFRLPLQEFDLEPGRVLHIGDDNIADFQMATLAGLKCCHLPLGDDYLAQLKYERRLMPLAVAGLEPLRKQWRWYSDGKPISYLAGQVYAPVLFSFAKWVIQECKKYLVQTLFCILREGDLISRLIKLIPGHCIEVRTLSISRRSSFLPAREWSVDLIYQLCQRRAYTLAEFFEDIGLECPKMWSEHQTLFLSDIVHSDNWKDLVIWLEEQRDKIKNHLSNQQELLAEYLAQQGVINSAEVAILDWGCGGSLLHNVNRVADLDTVHYFMFYASQRAIPIALTQKLHVFQTVACKDWSEQMAASPEISEILLNGTLCSTRAYTDNAGTIEPITVSRLAVSTTLDKKLDTFYHAVMVWSKNAAKSNWLDQGVNLSERRYFIAVLYRFVMYPTWQEAAAVADLPVPLACGQSIRLLPEADILKVRQSVNSACEAYRLLRDGATDQKQQGFWYPGLLTLAFPGELQLCGELAVYQDDDKVPPALLHILKSHNILETAVYGAGNLGTKVIDLLTYHGIAVTYIIDQRAKSGPFYIGDRKVITLDEAFKLGLNTYSVASRAFCSEIVQSIRSVYLTTGVEIKIITYRGII
ncbi:hypothetical protein [Alishewanella jeotgali]|uniref:Uncharacterized protein n=1 Tax=Alishewanella jeotgali KCTC 22429 TaxID=1129374 RepID=H3ZBJ9_9ALTE|nr:hypothetical protein [Alishewanella jeotgali]EHR42313.1 hypothetical protein AJE_03521 [Alishewanella jeotgali KCTC 22429]